MASMAEASDRLKPLKLVRGTVTSVVAVEITMLSPSQSSSGRSLSWYTFAPSASVTVSVFWAAAKPHPSTDITRKRNVFFIRKQTI